MHTPSALLGKASRILFSVFFLWSLAPQISAQGIPLVLNGPASSPLDRSARLIVEGVSLEAALSSLGLGAEISVVFSPSKLPKRNVTCNCYHLRVGEALDSLLKFTDLRYSVVGDHIIVELVEAPSFVNPSMPQPRLVRSEVRSPVGAGTLVTDTRSENPVRAGTITGRVVDQSTQRPLIGVQIFIQATGQGTLTNSDGQYVLLNVPDGPAVVRAQMIGYRQLEQATVVQPGGSAVVNFQLQEEALSLDAIVVTGTAGQARRREIGNSISQVDMQRLPEIPSNFESVLQSRAPGVTVTQAGGTVGAGAQIRLRGVSSITQGNQPLIYVDGIRISGEGAPLNSPGIGIGNRGDNSRVGSLNDINPADIQRIEIIKGPAATTLYGTEAAAGVVQIFTKRGVSGAPTWTVTMQQGINQSRKFAPDPEPYYRIDEVMRTGRRQEYGLSVSGGAENLSYFVSGSLLSNEGVLLNDAEEKGSVRANLQFKPAERLNLDITTSYTESGFTMTPQGNNAAGVTSIASRGATGGGLGENWREEIHKILDWDLSQNHSHIITGASATFTPYESLSSRFTFGLDRRHADMRNIRPFGFILEQNGIVSNTQWLSETKSLDWVTNFELPLGHIQSTWSAGTQYTESVEVQTLSASSGLAGPGIPTVDSGAVRTGSESRQRVVTGGVFGQLLLGFRDRLFLTLGLRVDGNSAFGADLGLQPYPKISGSYVISDEDWWNWGSMKLRAAYGHAGRAPGAFDAVRTWTPVGYRGAPGFYPSNVGNSELGPERSEEFELGFDSAWLDDRLAIEVTYYRQKTSDALFPVRQIPSSGWGGSQLENVGTVLNSGVELAINGDLVRGSRFTLDGGVSLTTNKNELLDLGGAPPFAVQYRSWVLEGHPAPTVTGYRLLNPDDIAAPEYEADHAFGPNYPTRIITAFSTLRMPAGVSLTARGEFQGGHYLWNEGVRNSLQRGGAHFCEADGSGPYRGAYDMIAQGRINELPAKVRAFCDSRNVRQDGPVVPGDFFRVRNITLDIPLPVDKFGIGGTNATLAISADNWFGWVNDEFIAFDPEMVHTSVTAESAGRTIAEGVPPPKSLSATVRVRF